MYYFMFSSGSYSDYSVGGLYVCDHEVTEKEWGDFYNAWQAELNGLRELLYQKLGYSYHHVPGYRSDETFLAVEEFKKHDPETLFQVMHNMVEVPVTEMWRDC
jgi:hypothetical protein